MKFLPVGTKRSCGQTDGNTDMTERMVTFRNFSYAPKKMRLDSEISLKDIWSQIHYSNSKV